MVELKKNFLQNPTSTFFILVGVRTINTQAGFFKLVKGV